MGASRALQRGVPLEPPLATHRRRSRSSAHLRRLQRTWVWVRCRAWVCSEQMSQSACHGQTRTLPFAARAYVGTFEETYGWKEPARRPSKAPGEWAGRRGGGAAGRRGGGRRQASGGSQRDWCTRDWSNGPPTRSRTISAVIRPARGDGCGGATRGECVVSRVCPSGWNMHSVHAAMRHHSCRRLPRFHQLETLGLAST